MNYDGTRTLGWDGQPSDLCDAKWCHCHLRQRAGARVVKKSEGSKATLYADAGVGIDMTDPANAAITHYSDPDLNIVASEAGSCLDAKCPGAMAACDEVALRMRDQISAPLLRSAQLMTRRHVLAGLIPTGG